MNKDAKRYKRMRDKVVAALGGKCPCGFCDARALQIDHVEGGGNDHRRTYGGRWRQFYEYVIGNPTQFQILCANCNAIKRIEQSEHRPKKFISADVVPSSLDTESYTEPHSSIPTPAIPPLTS